MQIGTAEISRIIKEQIQNYDKAVEVQTEYAKSSYETFVAESQKIASLYTDLAKQTFRPLESMAARFTPAAH